MSAVKVRLVAEVSDSSRLVTMLKDVEMPMPQVGMRVCHGEVDGEELLDSRVTSVEWVAKRDGSDGILMATVEDEADAEDVDDWVEGMKDNGWWVGDSLGVRG